MTTKELKARIAKALDEVPDSALAEVWQYLREVRGKSDNEIRRIHSLRRILQEDREMLERLAQ